MGAGRDERLVEQFIELQEAIADRPGRRAVNSRSRPGKQGEAFPGPLEVRHLLELTGAYANGLCDVLGVMEEAFGEAQVGGEGYVELLGHMRLLLSSQRDGSLWAIQRECRMLLGLETAS